MQPLIYLILFICHESFTRGNLKNLFDGRNVSGNNLQNIIDLNDNELNLLTLYPSNSYKLFELTKDETENIKKENIKDINEFLNYTINKKRKTLFNNIDFYELYFQIKYHNASHVLDHFSNKMVTYFNKTFQEDDAIADLDKQLVIFDIVETSNNLLHKFHLNVLNNITENKNYSSAVMHKFYGLLDDLQKDKKKDKEEEMKYLCVRFQICRPFPAFSDHLSDILCEIINFSDNTIGKIVVQVKTLIKERINFFREFLEDDIIKAIEDSLHSIFNLHEEDARGSLSLLKKILSRRHKFSKPKSSDKYIKAKAIRLLIDIVDKSFEKDDDEVLLMYLDTTKKNLHKMSEMTESGMGNILRDFVRYIVNTLIYTWTPDCKKEVKTLLEVLYINNKVAAEDVYRYLLNKGSQYVNAKRNTEFDLI